ncbi:MAG: efflux RND transporter periplasmic adaptor subunit [Acidobacteria bacterium]|nr:efflux RND transporter periplasmic adaptor subunit [Acidobacteriota bacterium]
MNTKSLLRTVLSTTAWVVLAVVAVTAVWAFVRTWQRVAQPAPEILQGQVEATEIDVSSKIPGRLDTIAVREGMTVKKGDVVATLDSPEIAAKLEQARSARTAASAQRDKANNGAREEEIRAAESTWRRAREAADLAERTFRRVDRLSKEGVTPGQRRDEAETVWKTARETEAAAKAVLDMAQNGARTEDKASATAMVGVANGAVAEVEAFAREMTIRAPAAGQVYRRNLEPGEMVAAGLPIVTLVDLDDVWATFHLREDRLSGMTVGTRLRASIPALGQRAAEFEVSYLAPEADYATWRPTSAQGGFDLKSFEVHARPVRPIPGLRPGMSVTIIGRQ